MFMHNPSQSHQSIKTVLVTGATGFLGSHLVNKLLQYGHQVIILKRSFSNTQRINKVLSNLIVYNIDKCDLAQPFRDFSKIDAVIHTATIYGRKQETVTEVFEANTAFPLSLLKAATDFQIGTFLNTDTSVDKNLSFHSLSKKHFMEWGQHFAMLGKIRFVNIELEHIFGPGDDDGKFPIFLINKCLSNTTTLDLTAGEQQRDFIYIDDVVSAYVLVLEKAPQQVSFYQQYELGSGKTVSIREFVETVKKLTNSAIELKFGVLPYREYETMYSQANLGTLQALGWMPECPLEESLRQTIYWYQKNHGISN